VKVELTPDAAQWVQAELAAGRFARPKTAFAMPSIRRSSPNCAPSSRRPKPNVANSRRMTYAVTDAIISIAMIRRPGRRCRASFAEPCAFSLRRVAPNSISLARTSALLLW